MFLNFSLSLVNLSTDMGQKFVVCGPIFRLIFSEAVYEHQPMWTILSVGKCILITRCKHTHTEMPVHLITRKGRKCCRDDRTCVTSNLASWDKMLSSTWGREVWKKRTHHRNVRTSMLQFCPQARETFCNLP